MREIVGSFQDRRDCLLAWLDGWWWMVMGIDCCMKKTMTMIRWSWVIAGAAYRSLNIN